MALVLTLYFLISFHSFHDIIGKQAAEEARTDFFGSLRDFQRGNDAPTNEYGGTVGKLSLQDKNTVFPYGTITFPDKTVWTRI